VNPKHLRIASVVASHAGPDNKCTITAEQIAREVKCRVSTVSYAQREMQQKGYVVIQHSRRGPDSLPDTLELMNVHGVVGVVPNYKRSLLDRISSWPITGAQHSVLWALAFRPMPGKPENENWSNVNLRELECASGHKDSGGAQISRTLKEIEELRRLNIHHQLGENRRPRPNQYELPPDGEDFVHGQPTRIWLRTSPDERRDRAGEELLLRSVDKLDVRSDGWRPTSKAHLGSLIGRHPNQVGNLVRRLKKENRLEVTLSQGEYGGVHLLVRLPGQGISNNRPGGRLVEPAPRSRGGRPRAVSDNLRRRDQEAARSCSLEQWCLFRDSVRYPLTSKIEKIGSWHHAYKLGGSEIREYLRTKKSQAKNAKTIPSGGLQKPPLEFL